MSEKMYCSDCLYDLQNLTSNKCPECGKRFMPNDISTYEITPSKPMHPLCFFIGSGLMALVIVWCLRSGGHLMMFVDIPSLLIVLGISLSGILMSSGLIKPIRAFIITLSGKRIYDVYEFEEYRKVMERGRNLAWSAGIIGMLVGLIAMLADLSDPSGIGAGLAVSLICPLYAAIIAELIFAQCDRFLVSRNQHMHRQHTKREPNLTKIAAAIILLAVIDTTFLIIASQNF
ncbi:MotA/TolQ/ExbB proton channel family protein [Planctomycetota bacterium]|nr:MotA/TolQ/ExbB proton channel family protein [Planctomycetota bacterium]